MLQCIHPGAWFEYKRERYKIWKAKIINKSIYDELPNPSKIKGKQIKAVIALPNKTISNAKFFSLRIRTVTKAKHTPEIKAIIFPQKP